MKQNHYSADRRTSAKALPLERRSPLRQTRAVVRQIPYHRKTRNRRR